MNILGVVSRLYSIAGRAVVDVAADTIAAGYTVGPCEVAEGIAAPAVGDRVLAVPVGVGSEQYVVTARFPG